MQQGGKGELMIQNSKIHNSYSYISLKQKRSYIKNLYKKNIKKIVNAQTLWLS